jgi:hypothetical protein
MVELSDVHLIRPNNDINVDKYKIDSIRTEFLNKYKDVFQSNIGVILNIKCTLKLKQNHNI